MDIRWILRTWLLPSTALLFLALTLFVLFTPKIPDKEQLDYGIVNVYLPFNLTYWINCDSPEFLKLSNDPNSLLEPKNTRQARPGPIILAYMLSLPISLITGLFPDAEKMFKIHHERVDESRFKLYNSLLPNYIAYIFLNFVILMIGLGCFLKLSTDNGKTSLLSFFFLSLFLFSGLVKAFFLSPHTQMFNYTYPLLGTYLAYLCTEGRFFNWRWLVGVSSLLGASMLIYSSSFAIFPSMLVGSILYYSQNKSLAPLKILVIHTFISLLLIALPTIFWILFVLYKTGTFYNHEVECCNQVVWFFKLFSGDLSKVISVTFERLIKYLSIVSIEFVPVYILGALSLFLSFVYKVNVKKFYSNNKNLVLSCLLSTFFFGAFFFFVGLYEWRMLLSSMPPMLLLVAFFTNYVISKLNYSQRKFAYSLVFVSILLLNVFTVFSAGPYG